MKIKIKTGVTYDTTAEHQTEAFNTWLRETILPQMAVSSNDEGVQPELDNYHRPVRWEIPAENCTVIIEREYVEPASPSWALKQDHINVTSNL